MTHTINSNIARSLHHNLVVIIMTMVRWEGGIVSMSSWVVSVSGAGNNSVESIMLVGGVVNGTDGTVWFNELVLAFDYISITSFVLGFVVSGVWIFNSVFELVFGVSLKSNLYWKTLLFWSLWHKILIFQKQLLISLNSLIYQYY